ncbi:hypothetical protein V6N13_099548 [Hibiscus sabdariffa]|uniref:Galactose oxidase-like Early set domain-containing protein n=1 Tax=Hibiscus sabdariffa TaxID=183260 RepID=A0ABR2Q009_9ROSI
MDRQFHHLRPRNVTVEYGGNSTGVAFAYERQFTIHFLLGIRPGKDVECSVYAPPFTTHSISMNQRLLPEVPANDERFWWFDDCCFGGSSVAECCTTW